jgi:hypothetical protein
MKEVLHTSNGGVPLFDILIKTLCHVYDDDLLCLIESDDFFISVVVLCHWVMGRLARRFRGKELPKTLEYFIRHFLGAGGGSNSIFW